MLNIKIIPLQRDSPYFISRNVRLAACGCKKVLPTIGSWPLSSLGVAALLAIAGRLLLAAQDGDGQQRRYVLRGN